MARILIIKTGATGDVVRTSVLLRLFHEDDITWVTAKHNKAVLPFRFENLTVVAIDDINNTDILKRNFDLVISLDDDKDCAMLASVLKAKDLLGAFWQDEKVNYTDSSSEWFDMGLSSRFGKEKADALKWQNKFSYQEILFRMFGKTFNGEEYLIPEDVLAKPQSRLAGIEARAGGRWPTKVWNKYDALATLLQDHNFDVRFFEERPTIAGYMQDISEVSLMICGDTLGMHIALALKIPLVTLFTCTSAAEIYGYGRMEKIVSPHLKEAFYKTAYIPAAVETISVAEVWEATQKQLALTSVLNS